MSAGKLFQMTAAAHENERLSLTNSSAVLFSKNAISDSVWKSLYIGTRS